MTPLLELAMNEGIVIPSVMFTVGGIISVTAIIASHWRKARKADADAQLKAMMIQRGMSVSDIERVMAAGGIRMEDLKER